MRVELLQRWNGFKSGKVLTPPDGVANLLITRRIAKPADEGQETATAPAAAERAVRFAKRGR